MRCSGATSKAALASIGSPLTVPLTVTDQNPGSSKSTPVASYTPTPSSPWRVRGPSPSGGAVPPATAVKAAGTSACLSSPSSCEAPASELLPRYQKARDNSPPNTSELSVVRRPARNRTGEHKSELQAIQHHADA